MKYEDCAAQHFGLWCIEPTWFAQALAAVQAGTWCAARPAADPADERGYMMQGPVAVIGIRGHMTRGSSSFGGTSTVATRKAIRSAVADPDVQALMLAVDSPGGTFAGNDELASDVRAAAAQKPMHAHIDGMAASAAYWAIAGVPRISATRTSSAGSIGTYTVLYDTSGRAEKEGVKAYVISTGAFKGAGADGVKLSPEYLAFVQEHVNDCNAHFLSAVQSGRRLTDEQLAAVSDGRFWLADKSKSLGLIDAIASWEEAMAALVSSLPPAPSKGPSWQMAARRVQLAHATAETFAGRDPAPLR